jgi:hypothetical protein
MAVQAVDSGSAACLHSGMAQAGFTECSTACVRKTPAARNTTVVCNHGLFCPIQNKKGGVVRHVALCFWVFFCGEITLLQRA